MCQKTIFAKFTSKKLNSIVAQTARKIIMNEFDYVAHSVLSIIIESLNNRLFFLTITGAGLSHWINMLGS